MIHPRQHMFSGCVLIVSPQAFLYLSEQGSNPSCISAHQGKQIYTIKFKQGDVERTGWISSSEMSFRAMMRMEQGCNV